MSSQVSDLTVRISTKADGAASGGLKQLADQSKKIAAETQSALDRVSKSDPFSRLARGGELTDRLSKTTRSLNEIGSGFSIVKKQAEGFFGISGQAKSVERSLSLIHDRVDNIRVSASKMRFDADLNPLFVKLRRVDGEVRKVRSAASGMMGASMGNFAGAGGGAMDMVRGVALLSSGDAMDKMFVRVMQFDAAMGILRGSKAIISGVVGGIVNLTNAFSAMSSATKMAGELAAIQAPLTAGLEATAAAQTEVAATANAAAAAQERLALAGGSVATTETAAAGTTASSAAAAAAGGLRLRHLIGAAAGYGISQAAGFGTAGTIATIAGTTLGAHYVPRMIGALNRGIPALASTATGWGGTAGGVVSGTSIMATGAGTVAAVASAAVAALAAAGLITVIANQSVATWVARHATFLQPHGVDLAASDATLARMHATAGQDASSFARYGITSHDLANREMNAVRFEAGERIADSNRNFDLEFASTVAGGRAMNAGMIHERRVGRQSVALSEAVAATTRGDANADTFARMRKESDELHRLMGIGGPGSAEASARLAAAQAQGTVLRGEHAELAENAATLQSKLARSMALKAERTSIEAELYGARDPASREELTRRLHATADPMARARIARQISGAQDPLVRADLEARLARNSQQDAAIGPINHDMVEEAVKRREESAKRIEAIERSIGAAKQNQLQTSLQQLATEQQQYATLAKSQRDQVLAIRTQQRSSAGSFGLMDTQDQARALDIAKQLSSGRGLSREDQEFARGIEPLQGMLGSLGRDQANRNGFFAQIEELGRGDPSRNEIARLTEREAAHNEAMAVRIENQLQVQATVNVESMARDLTRDLLPAIEQVQNSIRDSVAVTLREMARQLDERNRQALAAQNAGNAH